MLWAYVEGEYHRNPHRSLDGEPPLDRWGTVGDEVKYPAPGRDLDDLFLFEAKRQVQKDRTVSLDSVIYAVDAVLVGETVTLCFDPSRRGKPGSGLAQGPADPAGARRRHVCQLLRETGSPGEGDGGQEEAEPAQKAPPPPKSPIRFADTTGATDDNENKGGR